MNVGMEIDGVRTAPADAWVISREPGRVVLEIILRGGTKPADPEDVRAAWSGGSQIEARCGRTG